MNAKNYIIAHWKGEIGPIKSFLLNFLCTYIIAVFALVSLSHILKLPFFLGMTIFSIVMIWAGVGVVRSSIKNLRNKSASIFKKIIYLSILSLIGLATVISVLDILRIFGTTN